MRTARDFAGRVEGLREVKEEEKKCIKIYKLQLMICSFDLEYYAFAFTHQPLFLAFDSLTRLQFFPIKRRPSERDRMYWILVAGANMSGCCTGARRKAFKVAKVNETAAEEVRAKDLKGT